jgi:hypothetical protein
VQSTIFQASGHDAWSKTYDPNFTQNGVNIYQWMLMHQRGNTTTPPPPAANQPPTANAGPNQTITLPQNSITLSGSGSDPDGTIRFYEWSQASGPSQGTFSSLYSATPVVTGLIQGTYIFTLKVTDDKGATATSNVSITVNAAPPAPNQPPTADAGADQTITLPQNSVTLTGNGKDPDGSISAYEWSQVSGPSQANIVSVGSASTVVNNLTQGSYVFRLKVTDNSGATVTDDVTITVNAAPNQAPKADAGAGQTITLPQSSVTLSGSGTDPDGSIAAFQWSETSGPSQASIAAASSATTTVSNLVQGTYVFTLTVTDDKEATATSNVSIKVNQGPVANAGADQVVTLPTNSVDLLGSASDPDGSVASYQWSQIVGPTKTNFSSASPLALTVHDLAQGIYIFRLTVTDNDGATVWDDVKVTVMPDPRKPSTAMVYPNPATNTLYVKIDAVTLQNNSSIRITNSSGKVVYTENFVRTDFRILKQVDISKLPNGVYFLTVTTDISTSRTLTFIKE